MEIAVDLQLFEKMLNEGGPRFDNNYRLETPKEKESRLKSHRISQEVIRLEKERNHNPDDIFDKLSKLIRKHQSSKINFSSGKKDKRFLIGTNMTWLLIVLYLI